MFSFTVLFLIRLFQSNLMTRSVNLRNVVDAMSSLMDIDTPKLTSKNYVREFLYLVEKLPEYAQNDAVIGGEDFKIGTTRRTVNTALIIGHLDEKAPPKDRINIESISFSKSKRTFDLAVVDMNSDSSVMKFYVAAMSQANFFKFLDDKEANESLEYKSIVVALGKSVFKMELGKSKWVPMSNFNVTFKHVNFPKDYLWDPLLVPHCAVWNENTETWAYQFGDIISSDEHSTRCHFGNFKKDIFGRYWDYPSLAPVSLIFKRPCDRCMYPSPRDKNGTNSTEKPGLSKNESIHRRILTILTFCGLAVSALCLCCNIIVYTFMYKQKSQFSPVSCHPTKIILVISVVLLLKTVTYIFNVVAAFHSSRIVCKMAAMLLHFIVLNAITWSVVFSYNLFVSVVYASLKTALILLTTRNMLIKSGLVAFLLPLAIVMASNIAYPAQSGFAQQRKICWLGTQAFYYFFVVPCTCAFLVNLVVLICTASVICKYRRNTLSDISAGQSTDSVGTKAKQIFSMTSILCLTWLMGGLIQVVNTGYVVDIFLRYYFVLVNGFEGFWIFLFFCVLRKEARDKGMQLLHDCYKKLY